MTEVNQKGRYGKYVNAIVVLVDLIIINTAFGVTVWLNECLRADADLKALWLLADMAYIPVAYLSSLTAGRRVVQMESIIVNSLSAVATHALFFLAMVSLLDIQTMPWSAYVEFYGLCVLALPMWWMIAREIIKSFRRRGRNFVRVVIVGTGDTAMRAYSQLTGDEGFGFRVLGFFGEQRPSDSSLRYIGDISKLESFVRHALVDEIYYCPSSDDGVDTMREVIKIADDNVVKFFYVPSVPKYIARSFDSYNIGNTPVLSPRHNPLARGYNRIVKRSFDIVFSGVFLVFFPLLLVPVAVAIKLSSPGPVFFVQERTGYRGRSFRCLKFRTMRVNTQSDTVQATANDPRKTRVGDFLRRTNLDELPQFINVLKGEMSVVGPRPHMLKHTEQYSQLVDKYMVRHFVKPGITGWAQVNGYRGLTDEVWKMEKRVEYDVSYIENWSMPLDLKIIARTVINAIRGDKNAF